MNKRQIAKFAVKTVVQTIAGSAITKAVLAAIPASEQYHAAEIVGAVGGYVVGEELQPYTDKLVDNYADRLEARKVQNITTVR